MADQIETVRTYLAACIDGARMASPGLLAGALAAIDGDTRTVAGSFGLHLGPKPQQDSVAEGYDTATEDAMLAQSGWEEDGYRLFDVSVMGRSSGKGPDVLPTESNALAMHRDFWRALNGYDEGFASPGGGLANPDVWKRACEFPGARVRVLQGEGTFHQIHGGTTTRPDHQLRQVFEDEYAVLRGERFKRPAVEAEFLPRRDMAAE